MKDVIIIGKGPAGITASLYTVRAGLNTTVIGKDSGALSKASEIENYYGFETPISGGELISRGIAQAKNLGVNIIEDEVVGIGFEDMLTVKTANNVYKADSVIIATGSPRKAPEIEGLDKYNGKGISYCAVCDAFFYRGKDVAVLGCCDYALSEALELLPVVNSVTMITNGSKPIDNIPQEIKVIDTPIDRLLGDDLLTGVAFKDGTEISVAGLFVAVGVAGSSDLAKKLGVNTVGTKIAVDENMATNLPGLYAAGDCTGGMLQIAKAVYEGAKAGSEAIKYIRKKNGITHEV
ncbi:MAG: NAD(P)/FAD-dependent oxidoreductase [Bacillota bacterium]|nr:NAD(P)/FAD-dependent oxidoreductase [Bacillota bacterium]